MGDIERPWHWGLAPTHGNYCGPFTESNSAPLTATDAMCKDHDHCYDTAKDRKEELLCDELACEALDAVEDNAGNWIDSPGMYESTYRRGMQEVFCGVGDQCPIEAEEAVAPWEQKPQRDRIRRVLPRKHIVETVKAKEELEQAAAVLEKAAERIEKSGVTVHASVEPKVLRTEAKKARRQARRAAKKAQKSAKLAVAVRGPRLPNGRIYSKPKAQRKRAKRAKRMKVGGGATTYFEIRAQRRKPGAERVRVVGRELVNALKIATSGDNDSGQIIMTQNINPVLFTNTRLKQYGALFQRYRFNRIKFHFESSVGEFYNGRLLHYIDTDAQVSYAGIEGTEQALQIASAHDGEQSPKVNKDGWCQMTKNMAPQASYYMYWDSNTESKLNCIQGVYTAFVQDAVSMSTGSITYPLTLGRVLVEYDCEMWVAALASDNGYGVTGGSSIAADLYNGVQYIAWNKYDASNISLAANCLTSNNLLGLICQAINGTSIANSGNVTSATPTSGILSTNEVTFSSSGGSGLITAYGFGAKFRIWISFYIQGGTTLTFSGIPTCSVAAGSNCVISEAEYAYNTTTSSLFQVTLSAKVTVTDPTLAWTLTTGGSTNVTANTAATATHCNAHLEVRQIVDLVPAPTLQGCQHRYKLDKGKDLLDVMQKWNMETSCSKKDCPVCPFAKIAHMMSATSHAQVCEDSCSSDSDEEDDSVPKIDFHKIEKIKKKKDKEKEK